jgi:DNA polymerase
VTYQPDLFAPSPQHEDVEPSRTLDELHAKVRRCTRCPELVRSRTQPVPGIGPARARVMFIGEAPGRWEDEKGEPFVGEAGAYLTELLGKIGLDRREVFITNVIKCRPPENRSPNPNEIENCRPYLLRQIELVQPKLIVLLGRYALEEFFPKEKITQAKGKARPLTIGGRTIPALPLLHPAFGVRRQDLKPEIERDFWIIRDLLKEKSE